ncbi:MAG: RNA polymerase sigma factor [Vicinamibacterales bacterium]
MSQDERPDDATSPSAAEVLAEHGRFIEAVARRFTFGREQEAQDIAQDVAINLLSRGGLPALHSASVQTYLFSVVRNTAHSYFRREKKIDRTRERLARTHVDVVFDPDDLVANNQRRDRLHRAVARLRPLEQMEVRNLLSGAAVSTCSNTARKSRLHRARVQLRRILQSEADNA